MKNFIIIGAISMALFSCSQPEPKTEAATGQDFIGSIIQNDSTRVSFNVHLEENTLTFYNGIQESFEVVLSGEDTLRGTFPVSPLTYGSLRKKMGLKENITARTQITIDYLSS